VLIKERCTSACARWDILVDTSACPPLLRSAPPLSVLVPNPAIPRAPCSEGGDKDEATVGSLVAAIRRALHAPNLELELSLRPSENAELASGSKGGANLLAGRALSLVPGLLRPSAVLVAKCPEALPGGTISVCGRLLLTALLPTLLLHPLALVPFQIYLMPYIAAGACFVRRDADPRQEYSSLPLDDG
jgi:hypothetical protein